MKEQKKVVVLDAYFIKGISGVKPYDIVCSKILRENYKIIMSNELIGKYSKAIYKNNFSPIVFFEVTLQKEQVKKKLMYVDVEEMKDTDIKVKIEDEDDIPFIKAAFAAASKNNSVYIITQDGKHFLPKKEDFKKYGIEVLKPEEFLSIQENNCDPIEQLNSFIGKAYSSILNSSEQLLNHDPK